MSDTPQPMNREQADSKGIDPSENGQRTKERPIKDEGESNR
jgi:hypothetical protein